DRRSTEATLWEVDYQGALPWNRDVTSRSRSQRSTLLKRMHVLTMMAAFLTYEVMGGPRLLHSIYSSVKHRISEASPEVTIVDRSRRSPTFEMLDLDDDPLID